LSACLAARVTAAIKFSKILLTPTAVQNSAPRFAADPANPNCSAVARSRDLAVFPQDDHFVARW